MAAQVERREGSERRLSSAPGCTELVGGFVHLASAMRSGEEKEAVCSASEAEEHSALLAMREDAASERCASASTTCSIQRRGATGCLLI
jgi:hypothetical protein